MRVTQMDNDGELRGKLLAVESDVADLKTAVENIGNRLDQSISQMSLRVDSQIERIVSKFDEREKTPWNAILTSIGVLVTIIMFVGGLAFWPLNTGLAEMRVSQTELQKTLNSYMLTSGERYLKNDTFEGFAVRLNGAVQNIRDQMFSQTDKFVNWREHDRLLAQIQEMHRTLGTKEHESDQDKRMDGIVRRLEKLEK